MEKLKVPKLRFKEFSEEWEEKRLDSLMDFKNGINAGKDSYGKGVKFINVLDILNNNYITHDKIIGLVDVSQEIVEKNSVTYGDVLFQRSSETREDIGKSNVYLDEKNDNDKIEILLSAITNEGNGTGVWIYNSDSSTISFRKIEIDSLTVETALIKSGLSSEDKIVSLGAHFLHEGQKVRVSNKVFQ